MANYITLKDLSPDDQPREKLMEKGRAALSDAEILAILIGSGTREKTAVQLCQEILKDTQGDLNKLARLSLDDLMKYKGIGEAKAISIAAALELGRRRTPEQFDKTKAIKSAKDVFSIMRPKFADIDHEEFYMLVLSRANKVKFVEQISAGGFSGTAVDGKMIFKKALEKAASAIIICHNHPSGNLQPSQSDIEITNKLKEFGRFIDLPILDHLIITDESFYSFADNGLI
ncbi:MAG: DNA repair protein RadC [Crocinitomicaceae bacterium]